MAADVTLTELGDGVYAWLQPGGETGVANAGVVVDDDGITVIDTLMVRSQWEPFAAAVAELGPPVRRTILTHAHIDHVGGTKAFPNAAIYGSPVTRATRSTSAMPIDGYKKFMPAFDEEFDDLAELGTRPVTHLVDGAAQLTPRIEVLPASGHTAGDLHRARRRRRRAASPATSASSASRRSRSRATPRCGPTCSTRSSSSPT